MRMRDWRLGLVALHLPLPVWIGVELAAGSLTAFAVACAQFLITVIWGISRLGGLGLVLALTSFFNGLAGHQIARWHSVESAPWIKGIRLTDLDRHPRGSRYTFRDAHTLDHALGVVSRTSRSRSGNRNSSACYAVPIVDREGRSAEVMAWSVGTVHSARLFARGPEVSGTIADPGFSLGYADAIAASERKSGLRSHPSSIVLSLGDPAEQLDFTRRSIVIALVATNLVWILGCVPRRDE